MKARPAPHPSPSWRVQVVVLRASAQSVEQLQAEVQRLGKQLRNERLKAAAMSEQLETPLNVHRRASLMQHCAASAGAWACPCPQQSQAQHILCVELD